MILSENKSSCNIVTSNINTNEEHHDLILNKIDTLLNDGYYSLISTTSNFESAYHQIKEAYELSVEFQFPLKEVDSLTLLSIYYIYKTNYDEALKCISNGLTVSLTHKYQYGEACSYTGFGVYYASFGEFNRSLFYHEKAVEIYKILDIEDRRLGLSLFGIGLVHFEKKNLDTALEFFNKSLVVFEKSPLDFGIGRVVNLIGNVYYERGDFIKSLEYAQNSLQIFDRIENTIGLSRTLNDMGKIYQAIQIYDKAIHYFQEALKLRYEIDYKQGVITSHIDIAKFYLQINDITLAEKHLNEALEISEKVKSLGKQATVYKLFSEVYKKRSDVNKALEYFEKFHNLHVKSIKQDSETQIKYLQMSQEAEQITRENEVYRQKNFELATINFELKNALELIHDSINYARRIQNVILPEKNILKKYFKDSFVFYQPKDVVSGDFYWFAKNQDCIILAVVDCTGHGVPGAFMSMLGFSLLNQIVKENNITEPSEILNRLNLALIEVLKQQDDLSEVHDGMDIAIVKYNSETSELIFSGANLPLYLISQDQFKEIEPNKFSLGGNSKIYTKKKFESVQLKLMAGDVLYLFSDGFKDQFGLINEQKKKYSSKKFRNLLSEIYLYPMENQFTKIENEFNEWRGELKQLDDIIVIGIKL